MVGFTFVKCKINENDKDLSANFSPFCVFINSSYFLFTQTLVFMCTGKVWVFFYFNLSL